MLFHLILMYYIITISVFCTQHFIFADPTLISGISVLLRFYTKIACAKNSCVPSRSKCSTNERTSRRCSITRQCIEIEEKSFYIVVHLIHVSNKKNMIN